MREFIDILLFPGEFGNVLHVLVYLMFWGVIVGLPFGVLGWALMSL